MSLISSPNMTTQTPRYNIPAHRQGYDNHAEHYTGYPLAQDHHMAYAKDDFSDVDSLTGSDDGSSNDLDWSARKSVKAQLIIRPKVQGPAGKRGQRFAESPRPNPRQRTLAPAAGETSPTFGMGRLQVHEPVAMASDESFKQHLKGRVTAIQSVAFSAANQPIQLYPSYSGREKKDDASDKVNTSLSQLRDELDKIYEVKAVYLVVCKLENKIRSRNVYQLPSPQPRRVSGTSSRSNSPVNEAEKGAGHFQLSHFIRTYAYDNNLDVQVAAAAAAAAAKSDFYMENFGYVVQMGNTFAYVKKLSENELEHVQSILHNGHISLSNDNGEKFGRSALFDCKQKITFASGKHTVLHELSSSIHCIGDRNMTKDQSPKETLVLSYKANDITLKLTDDVQRLTEALLDTQVELASVNSQREGSAYSQTVLDATQERFKKFQLQLWSLLKSLCEAKQQLKVHRREFMRVFSIMALNEAKDMSFIVKKHDLQVNKLIQAIQQKQRNSFEQRQRQMPSLFQSDMFASFVDTSIEHGLLHQCTDRLDSLYEMHANLNAALRHFKTQEAGWRDVIKACDGAKQEAEDLKEILLNSLEYQVMLKRIEQPDAIDKMFNATPRQNYF